MRQTVLATAVRTISPCSWQATTARGCKPAPPQLPRPQSDRLLEGDGFAIARERIEEDAKFDGVFLLQTNANLSPLEAMLVYKLSHDQNLLGTRPI